MLLCKSQRALAVAAIAAVLVLAVTLLATRGVIDALLMIVIVAVLASMYLLRRYARAVLLYRRRSTPRRRHPDGEPVSSAPTASRVDTTGGLAVPTPSTLATRVNLMFRTGHEHSPARVGSCQ